MPTGRFYGEGELDRDTARSLRTLRKQMERNGVIFCTAATRPPIPFAGMRIYETDTLRELRHDGTGWIIMAEPMQTYTPTWTNVTLGTSTQESNGYYQRSNGWVDWGAHFRLGTGGVLTGAPTVSLPFAIEAPNAGTPRGRNRVVATFRDNSPVTYVAGGVNAWADAATTLGPLYNSVVASTVQHASPSATAPWTWAVDDTLTLDGRLRLDSIYA